MRKDIQHLLVPRYRVISHYPGSKFKLGDILSQPQKGGYFEGGEDENGRIIQMYETDVYYCPLIFEKMNWWEQRLEDEMPDFLKCGEIIYDWKNEADIKHDYGFVLKTSVRVIVFKDCSFATEQEYLSFINNQKEKQ